MSQISISDGVTSIGTGAFAYCNELLDVINYARVPQHLYSESFSSYNKLHVLPGYGDVYHAAEHWKNFTIMEDAVDPYSPATINLVDGNQYTRNTEQQGVNITYTRNYKNNSMQALFVPFEMSYEDWADQFDVYTINCMAEFDSDKDEIMDKLYLYVEKVSEGKTLRANYPYLIKAKEAGEKTIKVYNTTLYAADNLHTIECSTMKYSYTFIGTYNTVTNMGDMGAYAIAGGVPKQAGSNSATLAPYRWYMLVNKKESQFANEDTPQNLEVKIQVLEDEEEETNIDIANDLFLPREYYNMSGSRISKPGRGINLIKMSDGTVRKQLIR